MKVHITGEVYVLEAFMVGIPPKLGERNNILYFYFF